MSSENVHPWQKPYDFVTLGTALMRVRELVESRQPSDPYAREYSLRLIVGLGATTRDRLTYDGLRRPETALMWAQYGTDGIFSVKDVDELMTAQLIQEA